MIRLDNAKKWINPEKTDINWGTSLYWLVLILCLWAVALIQIFEWDITISSEIFLILTGGIGSYFIGKTASDAEKKKNQYYNKTMKTTLGIRPKVARALLALSITTIYIYLLAQEMLINASLTIFIDQTKYETLSTLFWAVVGFYIPTFYSLIIGQQELPVDIETKIRDLKNQGKEAKAIQKDLENENIRVPLKLISQYLE
ncbi:MAG: hypothetical protein ACFFC6_14050 [Promethearchaeota archaeon]